MYQLAVKPTWQTAVLRKRLKGRPNDFHIDLMDGMCKKKNVIIQTLLNAKNVLSCDTLN